MTPKCKKTKKAIDLSAYPSTSFLQTYLKEDLDTHPDLIFGGHYSLDTYKYWKDNPGNAIQFFQKSPRSYCIKNLTDEYIKSFRNAINDIKWVNIHSPYVLNFARPITENSRELKCFINDLVNLQKIHPRPHESGCVLHLGKNVKELGITNKEARKNMARAVRLAITETSDCQVKVILETSCNQGNEICWRIDKLAKLYKEIVTVPNSDIIDPYVDQRVGFCIDTAHIWSAGYDIRTAADINRFVHYFDQQIGWNKVSLIHFNDSKQEIHCCADRHEAIGKGYIGNIEKGGSLEGLKELVRICRYTNKPMVLETCGNYNEEIDMVKRWNTN